MPSEFTITQHEIVRLVGEGELDAAVERLKSLAHPRSGELYDEAVLQSARVRRLARDVRRGVLSSGDATVEQNRISLAVLGTLKAIVESEQGEAAIESSSPALASTPEVVERIPESILGINNLRQVAWLQAGLAAARSVCRILTPTGFGTGFLVGPGLIMTNNHVLPSAAIAEGSSAEFDYQLGADGSFLPAVRFPFEPASLHTSQPLDYTLVALRTPPGQASAAAWGSLRLNADADPIPSELVAIVQHPNGGPKQIAVSANCVVATKKHELLYTTDTMPGSSGSPVFNDAWQVVAIHHAGDVRHTTGRGKSRYVNAGVLMSAIRRDAGARWPQ